MKQFILFIFCVIGFLDFFRFFGSECRAAEDTMIEEFNFNMTVPNNHESQTLATGKSYYLKVSGTYSYGGGNLVDAAYRILDSGGTPIDPPTKFVDHDGIFAWDDGDDVFPEGYLEGFEDYNHRPIPDEYNSEHIYYYYFTGDGTTEKFQWVDGGGYGDNSGSLTFQIWSINETSENYSLSFDGDDDYVEIINEQNFDFGSGSFTLSAWFKTNGTIESGALDIIRKSDLPILPNQNFYYTMYAIPDGVEFNSNADPHPGMFAAKSLTRIDDGSWHHVVGVRNGTALVLYIDGVTNSTQNQPWDLSRSTDNSGPLRFGEGSYPEYGGQIQPEHRIDEVAVWDVALNENEIITLFENPEMEYNSNFGNYSSASSLVGYWRFNEGNGSTVTDLSGNENQGTIYGALWSTDYPGEPIVENYSLSFDGVDDYIVVPFSSSLSNLPNLTLQTWVYVDQPVTNAKTLLSQWGWRGIYLLYLEQNNLIMNLDGLSQGGYISYPLTDYVNQWINFSATYDGSYERLYVNGTFVHSIIATGNPSAEVSSEPMNMGREYPANYNYYGGKMDDVRIWNRALNEQEIQDKLYNKLNPAEETGLVGYWNFNEGNGDTAYDSSGYGNNGTIYGASWSTDVPPLNPSNINEEVLNNGKTPNRYSLKQNYPNPFNPFTTIKYQIPSSEVVNLSVYDVNGRLINTLENAFRNAGEHSIKWETSNLGSGIYFYMLKAGEFKEVKKCMLIK